MGTAGAWAVGAEHTARDAEDALRNRDGQNGRAGAARQVPASAAGAKTRRRREPASQRRAYAFQAGIAAVPRPRKASCPANALPLRAAGGRRGSLPVAARQGTGRAELQEAGRAPQLRAPGDGKPPARPRRPRHPALHSSRATRTDVCNHLCCHSADGGRGAGGRQAPPAGRGGWGAPPAALGGTRPLLAAMVLTSGDWETLDQGERGFWHNFEVSVRN